MAVPTLPPPQTVKRLPFHHLTPPPETHGPPLKPLALSVPVPGIEREVQVKIASKCREWEDAFRLLAANYQARGYEAPGDYLFRFTPYHALPDTTTFVAKTQGRVVATLSLVPDNRLLGLPMETIYGAEITELRQQGRRLTEVTSLADEGLSQREFIPVFLTLVRLLMQYTVAQGAATWLIAINPRHRSFYRKVLGFEPFGPWRAYPTVQNQPAEAYILDVPRMQANAPKMYEQMLGTPLPPEALVGHRMPPDLVQYFGSRSSQADRQSISQILKWVEQSGSPRRW